MPLKKKISVCILTKRILIQAHNLYTCPPPQKIYQLTQEIQQIDNKKTQ